MMNEHKDNVVNELVLQLQEQLAQLNSADNNQFSKLDTLLQQAAGKGDDINKQLYGAEGLLQFLNQKIDAADSLPLKEKIINKALKHLQGYQGSDMAGKVEYMIRNIMIEMDTEEKEKQTKAEKERNERINEAVGNSIAEALKRHGF
jgi:hypothetical protein